MKAMGWMLGGLVMGITLVACQKNTAPPPPAVVQPPTPTPATADTISAIRAAEPKALIGRVVVVLPTDRLAAIGEVPVQDFKVGDRLSFMGNEGFLTTGVVLRIESTVNVKWDPPGPKGRAPIAGDLCVKFPSPQP